MQVTTGIPNQTTAGAGSKPTIDPQGGGGIDQGDPKVATDSVEETTVTLSAEAMALAREDGGGGIDQGDP